MQVSESWPTLCLFSMLQRLTRSFLKIVASRCTSVRGQIRLSLPGNVPVPPYRFEVDFFEGELSGLFFIGMDGLGEEEQFRIPYNLKDPQISVRFCHGLNSNSCKRH